MSTLRVRVRRWLLVLLTLGVAGLFTARLITIQIVQSDMYKEMLNGYYISTQTVKATRGEIMDRNGSPLAMNRMGYDVIFDRAYFPPDQQNSTILAVMELFARLGETWTDNLPVTERAPFAFKEGYENEVTRLKSLLEAQPYASAEDTIYWLVERYKLQDYSPEDQRKIAGVRYEMEQRGFTWNVPYTFATDIGINSVIQIKERSYELPGVDVVESAVRTYPNGHLAPHIIGTVGPIYAEEYDDLKKKGYAMDDRMGRSGSEKAFETLLRGENGQRQIYIGGGSQVQVVENQPPLAGNTVVLTLDNELQQLAQEALERQILRLQQTAPAGQGREADAGAVVVLKADTGEVLAAATYPSYDLDSYSENYSKLVSDTELTPLVNRAVQGLYAPGSTFKPTVATAGLATGVIEEGSSVNCTRVYTHYSGYQPTCLSYHGHINVVTALTKSCNIFFYDTGRRAGIEQVMKYAAQYGLGQPTGIEIAENIGQISGPEAKAADPWNNEPWYPGDVLQSSIGQLYNEYTPLQLANYAATIGNRGRRMRVTLVHEVRDYAMNRVVEPFQADVLGQVDADREVFETVVKGMVAASRPGGTAAADFGYYPIDVASKTGTPETADLPNSTFICFAPADNPQVAIAVVIEKGWHGYTGAPVARELFDAYFGYGASGAAVAGEQSQASQSSQAEQSQADTSRPEEAAPEESGEESSIPTLW